MSEDAKNTEADQETANILAEVEAAADAIAGDPLAIEVSPQGQREMKIASVIQMHRVQGTMVKRGPGRPKKPDPETALQIAQYHRDMAQAHVEFVDNDPIVQAAGEHKEPAEMLRLVRQRLARIHASLDFRRIEDEKLGGKEAAQTLSRQVGTLREIAAIELKIKEMGVQTLDLHGAAMKKVYGLFVSKVQAVAAETLPENTMDLFINRLSTALDGWEEEAENLIR